MSKTKNPKFDFDLLIDTLLIQSCGGVGEDDKIMEFIKEKSVEFGGTYTTDSYGNIYVTKGKSNIYSCIVSHTDTVHPILKDFNIYQSGDTLFAFSSDYNTQVGIGGDDKCGVFIALNALKDLPVLKAVFFRHEESGCKGSSKATMDFFDNCNIVLQADRGGNSGFVTKIGNTELSSIEFQDQIKNILNKRQYKIIEGRTTDVATLKKRGLKICAANIECGYYNPHTDFEVVSINDVKNCYELILDIIKSCYEVKYNHVYIEEVKNKSSFYNFDLFNPPPTIYSSKEAVNETESDQQSIEEYLEEIDLCVTDLRSIIEDYINIRMKFDETLQKINKQKNKECNAFKV